MGKPYPSYQPTRCTAHSKRTGEPCGNWSIRGGTVCRKHGGAAKQTKEAAARRIFAAADRAAAAIVGLMEDRETPHAVKLAAARDLLDRAGLSMRNELTVEVKPWEGVIDRIIVDVDPAELPAGPSDQEAWDATEAEQDAAWDRACSPQRSTPVVYQPASRPADDHEADQHAVQQRVEPASFEDRPPARLDPDGLARTAAPRRRNREP